MKMPFIDLTAQYKTIKTEIDQAIEQVIRNNAFVGGPFVEKFEHAFAEFCGSDHAIGVGSGTEALWLSLVAIGVGRGDEVITVPNTFIATAEAISLSGATPVFVDIDNDTFNMDVLALKEAITPKTKAIIPVHLYGQMADMTPIMEVGKEYGLSIIEDACQAHGAAYHGIKAGNMGATGCFSFYPGKNLGAYGDAGAVVTSSVDLARTIRQLRDHGQSEKYRHQIPGWNARMDGIQGAILGVKLKHLPNWNSDRRRHAAYYNQRIDTLDELKTPVETPDTRHVYHIYPIITTYRDELFDYLTKNDIQCGIHYPIPIHLQPAYRDLNLPPGSFPRAEAIAEKQLSLPIYPEATEAQLAHVVDMLEAFFVHHQLNHQNSHPSQIAAV